MRDLKYWWIGSVVLLLITAAVWFEWQSDSGTKFDEQVSTPGATNDDRLTEESIEEAAVVGAATLRDGSPEEMPTVSPDVTAGPKLWEPLLATLMDRESAVYDQRVLALQSLAAERPEVTLQERLLNYLREPTGRTYHDRSDLVEAAIKNDVIEWLRSVRPAIDGLVDTLVEIADNPAQPVVMRDYALQHLAAWGRAIRDRDDDPLRQSVEVVQNALFEAVEKTEHSFAGTALLGLQELAEPGSPMETRLIEEIIRVAAAPEQSSLSRSTALQLLGGYDSTASLGLAEQILAGEAASELHLAAIGIIGAHAEDDHLLEGGGLGDDPRFVQAVHYARKRIEARIQGGKG